jgi:hypothetical protein
MPTVKNRCKGVNGWVSELAERFLYEGCIGGFAMFAVVGSAYFEESGDGTLKGGLGSQEASEVLDNGSTLRVYGATSFLRLVYSQENFTPY